MTIDSTSRAHAFGGPLQACMGGWCTQRDHCAHFHADDRNQPAERLCMRGDEVARDVFPVRVVRPVGTWERGGVTAQLLLPAQPFDGLPA